MQLQGHPIRGALFAYERIGTPSGVPFLFMKRIGIRRGLSPGALLRDRGGQSCAPHAIRGCRAQKATRQHRRAPVVLMILRRPKQRPETPPDAVFARASKLLQRRHILRVSLSELRIPPKEAPDDYSLCSATASIPTHNPTGCSACVCRGQRPRSRNQLGATTPRGRGMS